jgi:hypothetical protein
VPTQETIDIITEMRRISPMLIKAAEWGLTCEVVTFALDALKSNPGLSLSEAVSWGCREWDV